MAASGLTCLWQFLQTHTRTLSPYLQSDLRLARDKLKRKQAILVRQEEEVAAKEGSLAAAQREAQQLQVRGARGQQGQVAAASSGLAGW